MGGVRRVENDGAAHHRAAHDMPVTGQIGLACGFATIVPDELVDRFLESAHIRGIPSKQHGVYILVQ